MGSAVDKTNLTRELQALSRRRSGRASTSFDLRRERLESNYISYLSPKWMEMMGYTVSEAHRLGLGVDMTTGTGLVFWRPEVSDQDANANVVVKHTILALGKG